MKKLIDYLKKSDATGALWLLIFATVIAFHSAYSINKYLPMAIPYVQQFADEILPIKIENGKLLEPQEIKTYSNEYAGKPFSIVIDPTKDMLEEQEMKNGVYLTRSYLYSITDTEIRRQKLIDNINLPKQDYTPHMRLIIRWLFWGTLLLAPFFNFLCFLIAVLFYVFCSGFACILNRVTLDFKTKMRLNSLLFIGVYILSHLFYILGINFSVLAFFLLMIALQIVCVKPLGKEDKKPAKTKKK